MSVLFSSSNLEDVAFILTQLEERDPDLVAENETLERNLGERDVLLQKQTEPSRSNSERNISDIDIDIPDIVYCDSDVRFELDQRPEEQIARGRRAAE
ncbi:hypothetical protein ANN_02079 [Periplaneta americana]|uniref:Uncharacterized protein n=1 Tax=Periplaneta americana TaxID=6978 RepID=A0ABQ8TYC5_PERAM|nr:hypothetical protein ANN_02079 [Periplaneta americana]